MLEKIIITFGYSGEQKASYNWGTILHGALLELLPPELASMFHQSELRPFTQYVLPLSDQQLRWSIGIWEPNIAELFAQALLPLSKIELKHKELTLQVIDTQRMRISKQDYFARFFLHDDPCRRYQLEFLTPCTHKRDGKYVLFPVPELIIRSLYTRYSSFSQEFSLDDQETMEQLAGHLSIARYSLRSAVYYLERTKITGYLGKVTLSIGGPEQLVRLTGALLSFSEYAGIGIKTALGMGGVRVTEIRG
ncbi:MAG: CRISPR system precrRNA processing endoribonuclease RAMP protein Cas6 [Zhaonellaceae bacterium]|jgi:CRISPR-associated endoribonuclease Cas6|nr:CRISPR system precrRNA processing endoribonuclease RAMP protein Cas6 [Clostridia bacterium]